MVWPEVRGGPIDGLDTLLPKAGLNPGEGYWAGPEVAELKVVGGGGVLVLLAPYGVVGGGPLFEGDRGFRMFGDPGGKLPPGAFGRCGLANGFV